MDDISRLRADVHALATPVGRMVDTSSLEIELMGLALGPALQPFLGAVGMRSLGSRRDLDHLAQRLQSFFAL